VTSDVLKGTVHPGNIDMLCGITSDANDQVAKVAHTEKFPRLDNGDKGGSTIAGVNVQ